MVLAMILNPLQDQSMGTRWGYAHFSDVELKPRDLIVFVRKGAQRMEDRHSFSKIREYSF